MDVENPHARDTPEDARVVFRMPNFPEPAIGTPDRAMFDLAKRMNELGDAELNKKVRFWTTYVIFTTTTPYVFCRPNYSLYPKVHAARRPSDSSTKSKRALKQRKRNTSRARRHGVVGLKQKTKRPTKHGNGFKPYPQQ